MPRRRRYGMGGLVFHVMNRGSRRGPLFESPADYDRFDWLLRTALIKRPLRLLAFCAMPNHVHLLVWPDNDEQLPRFMHWLTCTHATRWRIANDTVGDGAVYQGRYKAIPVQTDHHFLTVARYVERNPVRAGLIAKADEWRWSSFWHREVIRDSFPLAAWPVARPSEWCDLVNQPQVPSEVAAIRRCVDSGCSIGNPSWQTEIGKTLGLPGPFRGRGRPRRNHS